MNWFAIKSINPGRLARDQLSTSSPANIQVTQFYKTHTFINVPQNIENARAGGELRVTFCKYQL